MRVPRLRLIPARDSERYRGSITKALNRAGSFRCPPRQLVVVVRDLEHGRLGRMVHCFRSHIPHLSRALPPMLWIIDGVSCHWARLLIRPVLISNRSLGVKKGQHLPTWTPSAVRLPGANGAIRQKKKRA